MNKIDSHQHFWKYDVAHHQWITPQMKAIRHDFLPKDLINILDNNDIEGTVAVQADSTEEETNFLIELANEYSFIKGVVGWVDLQADNVAQRLEYYSNFKKIIGFRHVVQDEPNPEFLLNKSFLNGIAMLEPMNYTYDVLIYEKQLPAANIFVKLFPNQKFVLDHIAKPKIAINQIKPWENQIREIARNENCYCKLSGLVTENDWNLWNEADFRPYLDVVFEAFGTKRLMFGSDWPVCMLATSYGQVIEIVDNYIKELSDFEKDRIWRLNATNFYTLK